MSRHYKLRSSKRSVTGWNGATPLFDVVGYSLAVYNDCAARREWPDAVVWLVVGAHWEEALMLKCENVDCDIPKTFYVFVDHADDLDGIVNANNYAIAHRLVAGGGRLVSSMRVIGAPILMGRLATVRLQKGAMAARVADPRFILVSANKLVRVSRHNMELVSLLRSCDPSRVLAGEYDGIARAYWEGEDALPEDVLEGLEPEAAGSMPAEPLYEYLVVGVLE